MVDVLLTSETNIRLQSLVIPDWGSKGSWELRTHRSSGGVLGPTCALTPPCLLKQPGQNLFVAPQSRKTMLAGTDCVSGLHPPQRVDTKPAATQLVWKQVSATFAVGSAVTVGSPVLPVFATLGFSPVKNTVFTSPNRIAFAGLAILAKRLATPLHSQFHTVSHSNLRNRA